MDRRGHLKVGKRRKAKPSRGSDQQLQLLAQLKELAGQTGIEVREERLHREIGYTVRGGRCVLDGTEVLLLDSSASAADCIEVLLDFLSQRDSQYLIDLDVLKQDNLSIFKFTFSHYHLTPLMLACAIGE